MRIMRPGSVRPGSIMSGSMRSRFLMSRNMVFGSVYRALSSIVSFAGLARLTSFVGFVGLAGLASLVSVGLLSNNVSADDDIDRVNVVVPSSCSFSDEVIPGDAEHSATMHNNEYKSDIGTTTFKAYCNDNNGYSVYAIGYSNDTYGNTNMIHDTDNTYSFGTGTVSSGDVSTWSMKLTPVAGTYAPTIQSDTNGAYTNYHVVPSTYTKVATFPNRTDVPATGTGIGSAFQTTYAVWISNSQIAGTYTGKVKYTLVHPNNEAAPLQPQISESGKICYYANASNAVGTMGCQTIPATGTTDGVSPTSATLLASNFSRDGYGFAGWSNKFDYATNTDSDLKFYGPMETITYTEGQYSGNNKGLSLYAVWVKSVGGLQDSNKVAELCGTTTTNGTLVQAPTNGTANLSSVSALTDQRDNQTYAIAKLADGKCWMIENLRLDNQYTVGNNQTDPSVTNASLSQGYNPSFIGLAEPESADFSNSTTANSLYSIDGSTASTISGSNQDYRFPRYNNDNTSQRAESTTNTNVNTYSYGNYYTWHAVIADTTHYTSGNYNTTSICPKGWILPRGGNKSNETDNDFWNLVVNGINNGTKPANYESSARPYYTGAPEGTNASIAVRAYPNNFLFSGGFNSSSAVNRGSLGFYWSSTAAGTSYSYGLVLTRTIVAPGAETRTMYYGSTARCVLGS